MEVFVGAGLLLSFAGWLILLHKKLRIPGWFSPLLVCCGISLILYLAGLAGGLETAAAVIYMAGLAAFLYGAVQLVQGKLTFRLPGPAMSCMILGSLVFLLLVSRQNLQHYDNFSHWALIVKCLLGTGRYPGAEETLIAFKDYPPGTAVFLYYVCRFLGHGEGVMLAAQTALILACFFAVFGIVREPRRFLLYSFLAMGCSMLSYLNLTIRINNLLVDFLLPLLTLGTLSMLVRFREEPVKAGLCAAVVWGYTGIVKSTGLFFAGAGFLFFAWKLLKSGAFPLRSRLGLLVLTTVLSLSPYALWQRHVAQELSDTDRKFSLSAQTEEYQAADPALHPQIIRKFAATACSLSGRAGQSFLFCNLLAVGAVIWARLFLRRRWRLGRTLALADGMILAYYTGLLGLYLYAMPEEEALRLAGFERYACSIMVLFAGILILQTESDMERSFAVGIDERGGYMAYSSPEAKRRYQYAVLASLVLALNFLYSEINGLIWIQSGYEDSLQGRVRAVSGDRWYPDGIPDERRYLVAALDQNGQVSDWSVWYVCRYFLYAPNVDVVSSLKSGQLEEILDSYDFILVLDPETVQSEPGAQGLDRLQETGLYETESLRLELL